MGGVVSIGVSPAASNHDAIYLSRAAHASKSEVILLASVFAFAPNA